jgi:hypothetical protein
MSERKNAWGRGPDAEPERSVADVTKNAFERNRDRIAAQHATAAASAADTKKIKDEAQRHFDATHKRTTTGAVMDQNLADAEAAYTADRQARRNQSTTEVHGVTTMRSLQANIQFWEDNADNAANFFRSEFNYVSLVNCYVTRVFGRHRPPTVEEVAEAYAECIAGNHLELPRRVDGNGATIRKRGERTQLPPTLYPAFCWPQEEIAARDAELRRALDTMLNRDPARQAEDATNRNRPLSELQREVRSQFKPNAVPRDVIGSGVL